MKIKTLLVIIYLLLFSFNSIAQNSERKFKIHTLAFYNLENLFDTINDVNKNDEASPITVSYTHLTLPTNREV